jgi:hypothetical protein
MPSGVTADLSGKYMNIIRKEPSIASGQGQIIPALGYFNSIMTALPVTLTRTSARRLNSLFRSLSRRIDWASLAPRKR